MGGSLVRGQQLIDRTLSEQTAVPCQLDIRELTLHCMSTVEAKETKDRTDQFKAFRSAST